MLHARDDYSSIQEITTNGTMRRIPADEPVFLIRGQDAVGGAAVRAWAELAEANGAGGHILAVARNHAAKMDAWPKKKVADLPDTAAVTPPASARVELPGGIRIVPVEPTPEMLSAAINRAEGLVDAVSLFREGWAAMLAAAPALAPPASDAGLAEVERLLSAALSEAHTAGEFGQTLDNGFVPHWRDKILSAFATQAATIARLQAELAAHGEGVTAELRALPRMAGPNPEGWTVSRPLLDEISDEATDKCGYDDAVLEQVEAIVLATERLILDRARIAAAPAPAAHDTSGEPHA